MPLKATLSSKNLLVALVVGAVIAIIAVAGITIWQRKQAEKTPEKIEAIQPIPIETQPVIEYPEATDPEAQLTEARKSSLGIENGVDLIVKADEALKLGDAIVPMKEILDRIKLRQGEIIESDIGQQLLSPMEVAPQNATQSAYGIYVVQPDDNIWNVHFQFLQDYFRNRGISLSPTSDEATVNGSSSGVGKLLKFSEKMVYIYNVRDRKLAVDLGLIHPLTKVVVFDMGRVFSLLDQIDYERVNRIEFDGEIIWIPAKQ
ncbi:MAG: hypothetical protein JRH15_21195 [Deltaproteobacteria bacterium]|nr:hypothetical protein [Deltaproteobacteria bacterium]